MTPKLHHSIPPLLLLCALCVSALQTHAQTPPGKLSGIRYAEVPPGADANHLSLDVYAPKDAKNLPVMIYIHGGGWRTRDKMAVGAKPAYFTARGFVFVSLNYRLVPAVDILTQLQDSANAIGWVKKHIAQHGGDPARLHLIGHSAGAHHFAILATNGRFLEQAGVALADLKSVVELDTQALDLPELMRGSDNALYQQAFGKDSEVWKQVSPRDHVAKDKGIPPFFLVVPTRADRSSATSSPATISAKPRAGTIPRASTLRLVAVRW